METITTELMADGQKRDGQGDRITTPARRAELDSAADIRSFVGRFRCGRAGESDFAALAGAEQRDRGDDLGCERLGLETLGFGRRPRGGGQRRKEGLFVGCRATPPYSMSVLWRSLVHDRQTPPASGLT